MIDPELDKVVEQKILTPVQFSEWAPPIVLVLKSNKKNVRICRDFKRTFNLGAITKHASYRSTGKYMNYPRFSVG